MKLLLTFCFLISTIGMFYFISGLFTWMIYKIKPENCKRELERKDINKYNIVILISVILYSFIFYNLI